MTFLECVGVGSGEVGYEYSMQTTRRIDEEGGRELSGDATVGVRRDSASRAAIVEV